MKCTEFGSVDAFGNALGSSLADKLSTPGVQEDKLGDFINEKLADQQQRENAAWDRHVSAVKAEGRGTWDDTPLPSVADQYVETYGGEVTQTGAKPRAQGPRLEVTPVGNPDSLDSDLAAAKALLKSLNRQDAKAAYSRDAAQATSDIYASGAGDVRGPFYSQADASDPFVIESSTLAGQGLKAPSDGFWRGFTNEGRSVLEGSSSFGENVGLTINGLVTGPVRAAYGLASEIGNEYKDAYNLLAQDSGSYMPSSALGNSLQHQGVFGTLGDISYSLASAPTKPVFDLLEGNYQAFGEGLPGMAAMGMGALRGVGSGFRLGTAENLSMDRVSLGLQTLDPTTTSFTQSWISYQKAGANYNLDSLVTSMKNDGWIGKPVDVVRMPDGTIASIDNTRILAARRAGIEYQGNVRGFDEVITDPVRQLSLRENGVVPNTWGEAAQMRIFKPTQNQTLPGWSQRFPYGSIYDPVVK